MGEAYELLQGIYGNAGTTTGTSANTIYISGTTGVLGGMAGLGYNGLSAYVQQPFQPPPMAAPAPNLNDPVEWLKKRVRDVEWHAN